MSKETYIRAILESNFAGFKEEIIETAVKKIMEYDDPVKHGKWIWVNGWVSCSVCGCEPPSETNITSNYCPNCGAKMDLKAQYCDRNKCLQMEYNGKGCAECGEVTE